MKKIHLLASITLISSAVLLPLPAHAASSDTVSTNISHNKINSIVKEYGKQIENNYKGISLKGGDDSRQSKLAKENSSDKDEMRNMGLVVKQAKVSSRIISVDKTDNSYSVIAEIKRDLYLAPIDGTTITVAGENRDHLDSSATDQHIIEISKGVGSGKPEAIVNDEIKDPDEAVEGGEQEQLNVPKMQPLLEENNDGRLQRGKGFSTNSAGLDYIKMALYAEKWTAADKMNPDFPIYKEEGESGNCANFVSQSVYAGGLRTTRGTSLQLWSDKVWTWNLSGIAGASRTWSGAQKNYNYMRNYSGAFTVENNPYHIGTGGLIYADWEGTGNIGHAMVVVGNINGAHPTPVICQKTVNRYDYPFTTSQQKAREQHGNRTVWKGLQWKVD